MKKQVVIIIGGIIVMFMIFFLFNRKPEIEEHPTLSASAQMPDYYLKNVKHYEEEDRHEISAYNLEKAIASIWKLEKDVDEESFQKLEKAIKRLETIHHSILEDSVDIQNMRVAFDYALNNLAHAELEIAEMYAETNHMDKANIAVKHAQLHIKNAMLFHNPFWEADSVQLAIEKHVFEEMENLLENVSVSPIEYTLSLDKMIKEIDQIIEKHQ